MALNTKNPFIDALGGTPWPKGHHTGGAGVKLNVSFSTGFDPLNIQTTLPWTYDERAEFMGAANTWSQVAKVVFSEQPLSARTDLIETKVRASAFVMTPGETTLADHQQPNGDVRAQLVGRYNVDSWNSPEQLRVGGKTYETFIH